VDRVLLSSPLPLSVEDSSWIRLKKRAKIETRSKSARTPFARDPRLGEASGVISLLTDKIDHEFFRRAPRLKVVANLAVGYNNIDLAEARRRGIIVCNTPDVLTNATAELTIGLIIAAARRFNEGNQLVLKKKFKGWAPDLLLGRELAGSKLGIIGLGRIGKAVARKAKALGMTVAHCGRSGALVPLLKNSDFISIHCPLTPQTHGLLSSKQFAQMKPGASLINTARGEIVDEDALLDALDNGKIRTASLDVFSGEPRLNSRLRAHPRVLVLPHLGSATVEARAAMSRLAVDAVTEVLCGRIPENRVL